MKRGIRKKIDEAARSATVRGPVVVFVGASLSMLVGIVFQSYLAARVGDGPLADIFYLGTTIPTLVATVVIGSAPNALMRSAIEDPRTLDPRVGDSVPRRMLPIAGLVGLVMAVLGAILLSARPGLFEPGVERGIGEFLVITAVVPILALYASIGAVRALARQQFVFGTYGGAVNGVGLLAAAVLLAQIRLGPAELAVAVDCGYVLQLLFVWHALWRRSNRQVAIAWHQTMPGLRAASHAFLVLAGASILFKSQPLIERLVGASLESGVPAALGYAEKITVGLTQVAVFGFSLAALPLLSHELHSGRSEGAVRRLSITLLGTVASVIAVVTFGLCFRNELVRLFYERGAFGRDATQTTQELVLYSLPSVAVGALAGPLSALWYAARKIRQVVVIGLVGFVLGAIATVALANLLGPRGIVLGTGVCYLVTFVIFATRVSSVLERWSWREFIGDYLIAISVSAIATGALGVGLVTVVTNVDMGTVGSLIVLGASLGVLLLCSLGACAAIARRRDRSKGSGGGQGATRVLWLTVGDRNVASSRVRAFALSEALDGRGIRSTCVVASGLRGRVRLLAMLASHRNPMVIVVQKILFGRVVLWLIRRRAQTLVWECDDAIHLTIEGEPLNDDSALVHLLRRTLATVDVVTTSNPLLAEEFKPINGHTFEFQGPAPPLTRGASVREKALVWLGSPSTESYLNLLGDLVIRLRRHGWKCLAMGGSIHAAELGWEVVDWSLSGQEELLGRASVGVMPQPTDEWAERKQGYKLYEYMAHGVVPVASDGLPTRLALNGREFQGCIVSKPDEWQAAIEQAAEKRNELLPHLNRVVEDLSVNTTLDRWCATMGVEP